MTETAADLTAQPLTRASLEVGDVLTYTPAVRHCREGMAFVTEIDANGCPVVRDIYWSSDRAFLTDEEIATGKVTFNRNEFERVYDKRSWVDYAEGDQATTHGQGRTTYYVRKGAIPSPQVRIDNARAELDQAIEDAKRAERLVETARRMVDYFLTQDGREPEFRHSAEQFAH